MFCSHTTSRGNRHTKHRADTEQRNANRPKQTKKNNIKSHTPSTKNKAHTHIRGESFVTKDENTTQGQTLAQREKFTKANHENKNNGKPDTPRNQD